MSEINEEKEIKNEVENGNELSELEKKRQYIEKVNEIMKEERIRIVLNQTNYSREEAIEKLENKKYDALKVIKEYMGIPEKKEVDSTKSLHQKKYDVIRECMDNAANNFRRQQEQAKIYNELMEKKKKEMEEKLKE